MLARYVISIDGDLMTFVLYNWCLVGNEVITSKFTGYSCLSVYRVLCIVLESTVMKTAVHGDEIMSLT